MPPELESDPEIPYPADAHGDVTLRFVIVIDAQGDVQSAKPDRAAPPFDEHAARAIRRWRFRPARREGRAVAAKIRIEVVFREPRAPAIEAPAPVTSAPASGTSATAGSATPAPSPPTPGGELVVYGDRVEPGRSATLTRAEVRQLPGAFGDPFRAIEALPGVTPIVSGLPFFFVRGAPPGNVGYFLDGVRVPLLYHVGIGPAVVHPALIQRVDLYPGGYPARFGRFAGGIVAGEVLGPLDRLHGEYNARLFDAGALLEAPLAEGRATVLVAGRYSYTAALLSAFSPTTTLDYWDYQARASYAATRDDTLSVLAFGSYDYLGERTQGETLTLFGTEFHRVDLRNDHRLGTRGSLRTALTLGQDRSLAQQDRSVRARLAGGRTELAYQLEPGVLLRAGTDLELTRNEVLLGSNPLSPSAAAAAENFPTRTDVALGGRADVVLTLGRLELVPGLRVDLYGSDGAAALGVDPRLATRLTVSDRWKLLTAFGVAHQAPSFVVPLPGFQPGGLHGGLQYAVQQSAGVDVTLDDVTSVTATVFQNGFFSMSDPLGSTALTPNGCLPGTFPVDSLAGDPGEQPTTPRRCGVPRFPVGTLGPDRSGGGGQAADSAGGRAAAQALEVRTQGRAYGLELYLKRRLTERFGGYVSYTLSRSTRSYDRREYVATFDRTHVASAAASYDLGRRWRVGSRVTFYTGLPKARDPIDGSTRLPSFFRVDLRGEKRWVLGRYTWISLVAEWMNATLSKEAVTTTCTLQGCEAQEIGPITIPSIGVEGGF